MKTAQNTNAGAASKTSTTKAPKSSNSSKALDNANLQKNTKGAVESPEDGRSTNHAGRAGKYIYPQIDGKDMTGEQKKAFRRQARKALRDFQASLEKLANVHTPGVKADRDKITKERDQFIANTYEKDSTTVLDAEAVPA